MRVGRLGATGLEHNPRKAWGVPLIAAEANGKALSLPLRSPKYLNFDRRGTGAWKAAARLFRLTARQQAQLLIDALHPNPSEQIIQNILNIQNQGLTPPDPFIPTHQRALLGGKSQESCPCAWHCRDTGWLPAIADAAVGRCTSHPVASVAFRLCANPRASWPRRIRNASLARHDRMVG